jgi:hypothetical protein
MVNNKHNIIGHLFLSAYLLVILHGVVPHTHGQVSCQINEVDQDEGIHHHHNTSHVHHNHHGTDHGILHTLGHLFNGFHNHDKGEEHFTHVKTPITNFELSFISEHNNVDGLPIVATNTFHCARDLKNYSAYTAPPLERSTSSALPLRAPPTRS